MTGGEIPIAFVAAAGVLAGALLSWGVFWMTLGTRISKAESQGVGALQEAAESKAAAAAAMERADKIADECHGRITRLAEENARYRENALREFVGRDTLREMETRVVQAQTRSEERFGAGLKAITDRLDRLIKGQGSS